MTRLVWGRFFGVLSQIAATGLLLASAWLIVRAAEQPPVLYLMVAIVSVRFFGLSRAALRYVERLLTHDAAFARVTEARIAVYRDLERAAPVGMPGQRRGDLVSRVVSDVDAVQDRMLRLRGPWIVALAASAVTIGLVVVLDLVSGLVLAIATVVSMLLVRAVVPWSVRRSGERSARWRGELAADVSPRACWPRPISWRTERRVSCGTRRTAASSVWPGPSAVRLSWPVWVRRSCWSPREPPSPSSPRSSGGLDPVLVGVVVLAPLALLEPLTALSEAEALRPGIEDAERRLSELGRASAAITDPPAPAPLPGSFDLDVTDLAIGWDTTLASRISFCLPPGEVVAVAGPSGVGKSTMALTLARLVEPRAGVIRLGGTDVRELAASDTRSVIGYLAQDEIVFDTTIRENLRIADPDATDAEMFTALRTAGMADFMASLPDGLDTTVGERGGRLSGGERQRLCLARLVLGGHRILVLDEPTEHLDQQTAETLLEDILALAPARSVVVISHAPWVLERLGRTVDLARAA